MTWGEFADLYAPPADRSLPPATRARQRADLIARIRDEQDEQARGAGSGAPARPPRSGRRWPSRPMTVLAVLGLLGGGVATATVLLQPAEPERTDIVTCFATATAPLDDPATFVQVTYLTAEDDPEATAGAALELCARPWSLGELSETPPYVRPVADPNAAPADSPVPPLVACVLPDGTVGVFPGSAAVCQRRSLAPSLSGGRPVTSLEDPGGASPSPP